MASVLLSLIAECGGAKQTYNIFRGKRTIGHSIALAKERFILLIFRFNFSVFSETARNKLVFNKVIATHNALQCYSGNNLTN